MKKEIIVGPMPFSHAQKALVNLQDHSGKFKMGGRPFIGDLSVSAGYGKKIGLISHDGKVRTRIDWDEKKGPHFNYEDFENDTKISILISDWDINDYFRYLDHMNKGFDENNVDMQFWRSRRIEGVSVIGYLKRVKMGKESLFRKPTKLYRKAMKGKMIEEVIETKRVM